MCRVESWFLHCAFKKTLLFVFSVSTGSWQVIERFPVYIIHQWFRGYLGFSLCKNPRKSLTVTKSFKHVGHSAIKKKSSWITDVTQHGSL